LQSFFVTRSLSLFGEGRPDQIVGHKLREIGRRKGGRDQLLHLRCTNTTTRAAKEHGVRGGEGKERNRARGEGERLTFSLWEFVLFEGEGRVDVELEQVVPLEGRHEQLGRGLGEKHIEIVDGAQLGGVARHAAFPKRRGGGAGRGTRQRAGDNAGGNFSVERVVEEEDGVAVNGGGGNDQLLGKEVAEAEGSGWGQD
jgi:hypothetical protein